MSKKQSPIFTPEFRQSLLELFQWRRDVRRFRSDPLPAGMLNQLIDTAGFAPSVGLSEPWRFVSVEEPSRRSAIRDDFERCNADALTAQASDRASLYARLKLAGLNDAPCHLAVFADRTRPWPGQAHHARDD